MMGRRIKGLPLPLSNLGIFFKLRDNYVHRLLGHAILRCGRYRLLRHHCGSLAFFFDNFFFIHGDTCVESVLTPNGGGV